MVQVGDSVPSVELQENQPGNNVDLSKELASGSGIIIGVPAAFSILHASRSSNQVPQANNLIPGPTCSDSHVPGYITHAKLKDAGKVFVISVNDAFVSVLPPLPTPSLTPSSMKAWGKSLSSQFAASEIRFLADPAGKFTRALDLEFGAAPMLGTNRSKRYAAVVKDGKFTRVEVEPDNVGMTVSGAENILG